MNKKTTKVVPHKKAVEKKKITRKTSPRVSSVSKKINRTIPAKIEWSKKFRINRRIASEFAIGITLILAVTIGVIFWIQDRIVEEQYMNSSINALKKVNKIVKETPVKKPAATVVDNKNNVSVENSGDVCKARLYVGESMLNGNYVLSTIPGTAKKDWLFKVSKEDIGKLPQAVSELLFIADATPEMIEKLKKATEKKTEAITVKGFYYDCQGVPVVSIGDARIAMAKFIKK